MKRSDVHYMGAGPSPLPHFVIEKAAQAFVNFERVGYLLWRSLIDHRLQLRFSRTIIIKFCSCYTYLCQEAVRKAYEISKEVDPRNFLLYR